MTSRCLLWTWAAAALISPQVAAAEESFCTSNQSCPPWQVCTTSVGECGSALSPYDVCTGTCESGRRFRFVLRAHGGYAGDLAPFAGALGLEIVPPFAGGHLSVACEAWTAGLFRLGPAISLPVTKGLVLSARADACVATGQWRACPGARVEYFPWWQLPWLTPAHYLSIALDGVAVIGEAEGRVRVSPAMMLGLGLWL